MAERDLKEFGFEVSHFGVNCENDDAKNIARLFATMFGIATTKDGKNSIYAGTFIELMKQPGKGKHGHIGIATNDVPSARAFFEESGFEFDASSAKYREDGTLNVLYFKDEIAGFAVHLLQK